MRSTHPGNGSTSPWACLMCCTFFSGMSKILQESLLSVSKATYELFSAVCRDTKTSGTVLYLFEKDTSLNMFRADIENA